MHLDVFCLQYCKGKEKKISAKIYLKQKSLDLFDQFVSIVKRFALSVMCFCTIQYNTIICIAHNSRLFSVNIFYLNLFLLTLLTLLVNKVIC